MKTEEFAGRMDEGEGSRVKIAAKLNKKENRKSSRDEGRTSGKDEKLRNS